MAVSRSFIRGLCSVSRGAAPYSIARPSVGMACSSSGSTSSVGSSSSSGRSLEATTSKVTLCHAAAAPFSTSAPARKDTPSTTDKTTFRAEDIERQRDESDEDHRATAPRQKRTLASFSMDDKVCVVTGAAMGLGNVMARAFIESGASKLAILDLSAEKATAAADEAQRWFEDAYGGGGGAELDIVGVQCDVADEASVAAAMDDVHKRFGRIDVCVNSAGVVENFPAETYSTARMKWLYDINLNGSMYVAREAAKHMFADGNQGSIILVASMSGSIVNLPQPQAPYNASKAAVKHLASCLAVEWATRGVRVNSLSPGYMLTSLTRVMTETSSEGKKLREAWEAKTPMGRMGEPDDLKGAAVYLASDASRFTTGTDLIVDGGYCCP